MNQVITDKERDIVYRKWPASQPKAVLILIHGLCGQSNRWEVLADFFQQNNISSYAIDLKGFGETKGLPGHIDSFDKYLADIRSLYDIIHTENRHCPIFLLGESMGALISFLAAARAPELFDGLICISPAFKSKLKFTALNFLHIFLSLIYNPKKQFRVPFESRMFTRDTVSQERIEADYREHRLVSSKLLFNILIAQKQCETQKDKLKTPVLFLLAGKDLMVDTKTSEKFFSNLAIPDKGIIVYPDMYHALSIDLGKEKVFGDILSWIKQKTGAIS